MKASKEYWSMTEGVWNCLIDTKRTRAFQRAIRNTVSKGDVVVDLGTGSGVLALFAAQAGAKRVYAIESDPRNVRTLRETFRANQATNIVLIEGDATRVKIPEPCDCIIGEMIATGLIEELQVPAINNALQYAKPGAKI